MSFIPENVPITFLRTVGQKENEEQYLALMGPVTKKQLAEMGMVKDSSITKI